MMSGSGPLSVALSHRKPFLVSNTLAKTLQNDDVKFVLSQLQLTQADLTFNLRGCDFEKTLLNLTRDRKKIKKLIQFSSSLGYLRDWGQIVAEYEQVLARLPLKTLEKNRLKTYTSLTGR